MNFFKLPVAISSAFLVFATLLTASVASAVQNLQVHTIKTIFAEGYGQAGFYTVGGLTQCLYQVMYIDLNSESGKAQLSLAISAKAANQKIVRMDYVVAPEGQCKLQGMHIE
jgi:hypothetical protein